MQHDDEQHPAPDQAKRREALKKLAAFGAYTAPFVLGTLTATKAVAQSGGGGGCCWVEAHLASGQRVGDAIAGDALKMLGEDGETITAGVVQRTRLSDQPCLRFETVSGIALTLSDSTPIAVKRGGPMEFLRAADIIKGDVLPVEDAAGFRWEPLATIEDRGVLPVSLLSANDGVYAAGDRPGSTIYTHNVIVK